MVLINRKPSLAKHFHIFITMSLIIFLLESLVMFILPLLFPDTNNSLQNFADAFILSVLSAPFTWLLIARPLRTDAQTELTRINAVLDFIVDAVISFDERGTIESLNPAAEEMFGYPLHELAGQNFALIIPETGAESEATPFPSASVETGSDFHANYEALGCSNNGTSFPVEISISQLRLGGRLTFIAIIHDITERKRAKARIEEQKEFVENLVQNSAVPTFVLNAQHRVLIWNRACEELTGIKAEAVLGTDEPWRAFYDHKRPVLADIVIDGNMEHAPDCYRTFGKSGLIPEGLQAEGWYPDLNGMDRYIYFNAAPIRNGRGELLAVIESLEDITERKRYEEQLEYQASHDGLTNLPNRNLLSDRIQQALLVARRKQQQLAVLSVGLDNFKFINDSQGHAVGDLLLKIVAERLTGCVRGGDTVARQGGDEFVLVISELAEAEHASQIADKIQITLAEPFQINEHEFVVTCSIGISVFPKDGEDVQTLLKNADMAMYRAKEQGRNNFQFYTGEMNARTLARMTIENLLRRALEKNELLLHYQPKVDLRTGQITGMEALIRWQSPELGMVSPANFIPIAEETGLIEQIGEWVIRTACAQNKAWQNANLPPLPIAVNLSPRQFRQKNLCSVISRVLQETNLNPRYLELEVTESMVMHNMDWAISTLKKLKEMGMYLAMDDFGTGYSSLSYLKRFSFDKLKIDQSFVRDITSDPDSAAIARAVIAMAHSLHLKVIAEGVETIGQLNYLLLNECDEIQGYYFSRPIPVADFEQLLHERRQLQLPEQNHLCSIKTLLIVDDVEEVATALAEVLAIDGYHILTATSALEGFELLANHQVAVVLSDQRMHGMNGSEFLSRVKELYPDTIRIIMSGHADLDAVTDAINRGAIYKFLSKPWKEEDIREKIVEAFRHYESMHGRARGISGEYWDRAERSGQTDHLMASR